MQTSAFQVPLADPPMPACVLLLIFIIAGDLKVYNLQVFAGIYLYPTVRVNSLFSLDGSAMPFFLTSPGHCSAKISSL